MIEIVPFSEVWHENFFEQKNIILENCSNHVHSILHIGSTSIKGMIAKPKIDILLKVKNILDFDFYNLEKSGFRVKGEFNIPMRIYASSSSNDYKVNLHVISKNDPYADLLVGFRDYIASNLDAFNQYKNLKLELSKLESASDKNGNIGLLNNYNLGKNLFIRSIIKKMGFNKNYATFCAHDSEIEFCEQFQSSDLNFSAYNRHIVLNSGSSYAGYIHAQKNENSDFQIQYIKMLKEYKNEQNYFLELFTNWVNFNNKFLEFQNSR
jgi:GrpB-like predicted nucleotidyltransferase (UPF0157 family)